MKQKFIYVFDKQTRDKMISLGYTLLKSDKRSGIFVFENNGRAVYADLDIRCAFSDTISF